MAVEIISLIVALGALLSTTISNIVIHISNKKHQSSMQKTSFLINYRFALYRDFLDTLNSTLPPDTMTLDKSAKLKQIFSTVYLVCSDDTQYLLDELNELMASTEKSEVARLTQYQNLCQSIMYSMRAELAELREI